MSKETYKVTKKHIKDAAVEMWWEANPLSLAMLEAWGGFHIVNEAVTTVTNNEIGRVYRLSREAQALVKSFRGGRKIRPCVVVVEFVEQNFYKQFYGKGRGR